MTPPVPTEAQTCYLLALSRGDRPWMQAQPRAIMLRHRWIVPRASCGKREYDITDKGRQAMATSPHLSEAQRRLDTEGLRRPW